MSERLSVLADLAARDLIHDHTDLDALGERLAAGPVTLYHGIDPTADSLHTGNLIGLLVLRRFQDAGHRPLALAGGATGMVGDPSGRSDERNLLDEQTLDHNVRSITAQMARLLDTSAPNGAALLDNRAWTADLTVIDFLRDVGKHVTVNTMLARESVRVRLEGEAGLSFTEFSYMLLQANDYLWLSDHHHCELQVGGSDQWGNIIAGVDLIRRTRQRSVHALSWPLITAADGTKLGKTTGARVWLDPARTSPYRFYQHWINTDDREVRRFLAQFTLLPVPVVDEVVADHLAHPERRLAQRRLAAEVTALVHGEAAAAAAEAASSILFGGPIHDATPAALDSVADEVPTHHVSRAALQAGLELSDVLATSGLTRSRSEARRAIDQGGAYVNNERADGSTALGPDRLLFDRWILLSRGRRNHALVVAED